MNRILLIGNRTNCVTSKIKLVFYLVQVLEENNDVCKGLRISGIPPPPINVVLVPLSANFVKLVCMHVNNCTVEEYP